MNAVEIAMKMETDAIEFYREAAERTSHTVGKKMFLSVAEDEKRHLKMLGDILKGLDIKAADASPMKNLKSVFESHKDEMMKRAEATGDDLEAFKIAMEMEKEGLEFYQKTAGQTKDPKEKALFERLSKEEEEHYRAFSNTHFFLKDTGSWFMWEEHSIVEG